MLVVALTCLPIGGNAQPAGASYRLGYLGMASEPNAKDRRLEMFRRGLRDLGYVEGQNIALEVRYAYGKPELFPDLAKDLVRRKVDVIITSTGIAAIAASKV